MAEDLYALTKRQIDALAAALRKVEAQSINNARGYMSGAQPMQMRIGKVSGAALTTGTTTAYPVTWYRSTSSTSAETIRTHAISAGVTTDTICNAYDWFASSPTTGEKVLAFRPIPSPRWYFIKPGSVTFPAVCHLYLNADTTYGPSQLYPSFATGSLCSWMVSTGPAGSTGSEVRFSSVVNGQYVSLSWAAMLDAASTNSHSSTDAAVSQVQVEIDDGLGFGFVVPPGNTIGYMQHRGPGSFVGSSDVVSPTNHWKGTVCGQGFIESCTTDHKVRFSLNQLEGNFPLKIRSKTNLCVRVEQRTA